MAPVLLGQFHLAPGQRVDIRPAAGPEEPDCPRVRLLEKHLRVAGVISGPFVVAQHRGVAGVAKRRRHQPAFTVVHTQHRDIVVDRALQFAPGTQFRHVGLGVVAAVHADARRAAPPRQARRLQPAKGFPGGCHDFFLQLFRVRLHPLPHARRKKIHGTKILPDDRPGVGVGRAEQDLASLQPVPLNQPRATRHRDAAVDADQIQRDQERLASPGILQRQRLDPEIHPRAFRRPVA